MAATGAKDMAVASRRMARKRSNKGFGAILGLSYLGGEWRMRVLVVEVFIAMKPGTIFRS